MWKTTCFARIGLKSHNRGMEPLRDLPSIDRLLSDPAMSDCGASREHLKRIGRALLEELRKAGNGMPNFDDLVSETIARAMAQREIGLRYAINATGVVLHTGLGRARLSESARKAVEEAARGHAILEVDEETGLRGSRQERARELLTALTGAEDAFVCNNNAAAVMLCVNTLAAGREAIISRGQCVEIGGSFRMPDVIRSAGAALIEVGTTNKTRQSDYAKAITERTGCIVRCHPSNFKVVGFTEEVSAGQMAGLGVPLVDDVGSGCLVDTERFGLPHEPTLSEAVGTGAHLVTASGDKLLGGPQAGIVLGKRAFVERIAKNPLARAVRCDKLTLAALEATLREYLDADKALQNIPTLAYLARTRSEIEELALRLSEAVPGSGLVEGVSEVGGGSLPGCELPSWLVQLSSTANPQELAQRLRTGRPALFARILEDKVCLDPRTIEEWEIGPAVEAIRAANR